MKFELFNTQDELVLSADIKEVGKSWIHFGPVVYKGDTSLLDWCKNPASGDMLGVYFRAAAHKHGLRYKCDTIHLRAL
ncbi:hypothetical protein [Prosthecobacter sp.]|uniref:hypothetical protein n=1 Tax=Prosthecobacter sp. TaxID=1965333 RepID=UPI00378371FF